MYLYNFNIYIKIDYLNICHIHKIYIDNINDKYKKYYS